MNNILTGTLCKAQTDLFEKILVYKRSNKRNIFMYYTLIY